VFVNEEHGAEAREFGSDEERKIRESIWRSTLRNQVLLTGFHTTTSTLTKQGGFFV